MKKPVLSIKTVFTVLAAIVLLTACGMGKGCDCPSFGQKEVIKTEHAS